ncbi:unnamed protein product [Bemisia tabaci]|uniref:Uncharacterized protein n=1 Tax=Bemisia tabaci TaxID=7038 RepID=A0A9P0F0H4_BEMTA|nr:unnamed protein product [Bemisia tabaci]
MERQESEPNQASTREGITLLNNPAVVASVYLDPRFFPMLSEEAKDTAERVLRELNGEDATNAKEAADKALTPKPVDPTSRRNILREKILEKNRQRNIVPLSNDRNVIDEQLLSYRNSVELFEDVDTNILEWWTDIGILKWPELYALTRIVHAAPAT